MGYKTFIQMMGVMGCCVALPAYAKVSFTARSFVHDQNTQEVHAVGNVIMQTAKGSLYADEVWINVETDQVRGQGNVVLEGPNLKIEANSFDYNIKSEKGVFDDFLLSAKDVQIKGERLERLDREHYVITRGSYSPCKGYCKDWQISGTSIDVNIGGYVWITNALVQVSDIPTVYLPLAVLPAKRERESGFLFPYFSYLNTVGSIFSFPYFVNLSPHTDVTLTPQIYSSRGYGLLTEHRYMLSPTWEGITYLDYIYEDVAKNSLFGIKTHNKAFWETSGLSASFRGLTGSETRYFNEYMKDTGDQGLSAVPQTLGVHYGPQWLDVSTRLSYVQDVLPRQRLTDGSAPFVLPWVRLQSKLWKPLSWVGISLEAGVLNLRRFSDAGTDAGVDEIPPAENIIFQGDVLSSAVDDFAGLDDNDVVVGLTRYELNPHMVMTTSVADSLRWDGRFSFPYRYYALPSQKFATFASPLLEDQLSVSLDRIYLTGDDTGFRHVFTPSLVHAYRPKVFRTGHTLFFKSPNGGMDATDGRVSAHSLGINLANNITEKIGEQYRTLMTVGLAWSYFTDFGISLEPGQTVQAIGPITSNTALYFERVSLFLETSTDIKNDFVTDLSGTLSYVPLSWLTVSANATSKAADSDRSFQGQGGVTIGKIWNAITLSSIISHSFTTGEVQSQAYSLTIIPPSGCWTFTFELNRRIGEESFSFFPYFSINFGEYFGGSRSIRSDALGAYLDAQDQS